MGAADGQQHVAGVQGTGGTGGAGGGADPLVVQQQQHGLALDALKAEAHIAGQAVFPVTVEHPVGDAGKPLNKPVPQIGDAGLVFLHVGAGLVQGRRHAYHAGHILGARTAAPLLGAALDQAGEQDALAGVEGAHPLGPVEFVGRQGEHVDVFRPHVDGQMSRRLHRIGVEKDVLFPADGPDLSHRLDGADLVVGVHDGDQAGVGADGRGHVLRPDDAVFRHRDKGDLIPFLFQPLEGVEHGVVLDGGGDDVPFVLAGAQGSRRTDGLVVGLAAPRGEGDLGRIAVQVPGDGGPGGVQGLVGPLAEGVQAGRIAVLLPEIGQHGGQGGVTQPGGRRVVQIDVHGMLLCPPERTLVSDYSANSAVER